MKHVCVTAKISDDAKDGAGLIANKAKPSDKVSADFRCNPPGWHEFLLRAASHALRLFAIGAAARSLPGAKIVTAHHAFHAVRRSEDLGGK